MRPTGVLLTICLAVVGTVGTASADWVTATVDAGMGSCAVAVDPGTNKIYVTGKSYAGGCTEGI